MAKPAAKRPKSSLWTKILIFVLILGLGSQLYRLSNEIRSAQADQALLTAQVEQLRQENTSLAQDIENGDNEELLEKIAREELGLVKPDEKIFYINNH
jgi:cell division protein FtsL